MRAILAVLKFGVAVMRPIPGPDGLHHEVQSLQVIGPAPNLFGRHPSQSLIWGQCTANSGDTDTPILDLH